MRIALLTEGEFFGETDLVSDKPSDMTVQTITPCVLLTLSRKDLDLALGEEPSLEDDFRRVIDEHVALRSTVNRYGERNIDLVSDLQRTSRFRRPSSIMPSIRGNTHCRRCRRWCACTRACRFYTTGRSYQFSWKKDSAHGRGIKERQEWELINNTKFGLLHAADPGDAHQHALRSPTPTT